MPNIGENSIIIIMMIIIIAIFFLSLDQKKQLSLSVLTHSVIMSYFIKTLLVLDEKVTMKKKK